MVASVVVRAAEVIAKGSGVPLWQRRSAQATVGVDGVTPSSAKRACGKRSTFCHAIMSELNIYLSFNFTFCALSHGILQNSFQLSISIARHNTRVRALANSHLSHPPVATSSRRDVISLLVRHIARARHTTLSFIVRPPRSSRNIPSAAVVPRS